MSSIENFLADAAAASERLVLIVAGTSGRVLPAATVVEWAREAGAETWLVNQEPTALSAFDHFLSASCGRALPELISKDLGELRTLRTVIGERTVDLVIPLPEGSRSVTGVPATEPASTRWPRPRTAPGSSIGAAS